MEAEEQRGICQRRRQADAFIVLLLLTLPLAFFWRLAAPDPRDRRAFAYGDFVEQYYPLRRFAAGELKRGRWPLWNPNIYAGQPALADIQSGALYPIAWVTAAVTGRRDLPFLALEGEAVLHFGLAGLFTYLLARRLTGQRGGALIAALTFTFGGYLTAYPSLQLTILETDVWLPAILLCLERGLRGDLRRDALALNHRYIALGGVALAVALLAGHPQSFTYVFYTSALYFAFRAWTTLMSPGLGLGWRRSLLALALWAGVGAGLSAAQWVPTLELARLSSRATISYAEVSAGFPLGDVVQVLWPGRVSQWSPLCVGLLPLALAVLAPWARRGRFLRQGDKEMGRQGARRHLSLSPCLQVSLSQLWGGLALAALLLSFGDRGLLFKLFYLVVPGFRLFRSQERAAFVFSFAMAMLAGYGAAALADRLDRRMAGRKRDKALAPVPGCVFGGPRACPEPTLRAQCGRLREGTGLGAYIKIPGLAAAFIVVDLFRANAGQTLQPVPPGGYFPVTTAVALIGQDQDRPFRVSSEGLLPVDGNAGIIYGFQDVTGNSPLHLARYQDFLADVSELRRWQLLGVRYVLTRRELTHGALWPVLRDADGAGLYRFGWELPRAWVVHQAVMAADEGEARRLVDALDFQPERTVVLLEPPAVSLPVSPVEGSAARVLSYEPTRLVVQADLTADGLLVLGEVYYPGWRAMANGRPVPILLADGLLRAVPLRQGSWQVELVYDPLSFKLGLGLSLSTAIGVATWIVATQMRQGDRVRGRQGAKEPFPCLLVSLSPCLRRGGGNLWEASWAFMSTLFSLVSKSSSSRPNPASSRRWTTAMPLSGGR